VLIIDYGLLYGKGRSIKMTNLALLFEDLNIIRVLVLVAFANDHLQLNPG